MTAALLWGVAVILLVAGLGLLFYWLVVVTEGVFLGRRVVVWLYDITAHKYDRVKAFDDEAERFFVIRPLLHHLQHRPAPRILDVATGTGRVPLFLLNEPTFHGRIYGLDASQKMLALAAIKLRPFDYRAGLVRQAAVPLPFADATFDAVTCLEALEFFPSDTAALEEMVRVLRPGGLLMVTRRRGREARLFFGRRHRTRDQVESYLAGLGLVEVSMLPWQVDYDQVLARKPEAGG